MPIDSTSEAAIFERIMLAKEPKLSREGARSLLAIGFGSDDTERMQALAERARQGILTPAEQQEIDNYERVGQYLAILKSTVR